jgi:hypothetical protein
MVSALRSAVLRDLPVSSTRQFREKFRLLPRVFSSSSDNCDCSLLAEEVRSSMIERDFTTLKNQLNKCKVGSEFNKWHGYKVNPNPILEAKCKALSSIQEELHILLASQPNIRTSVEIISLTRNDLNAIFVRDGEVTLAGEGGAIVGKPEYWVSFFNGNKEVPIQIISIGGGRGYDAKAIAKVFREKGFQVEKPQIIDPNHFAAYLSNPGDVDFYPTPCQKYFSKFFPKQESKVVHLFHLGTVLNVVSESTAIEILKSVIDHMFSRDIISILMVDEKQFQKISREEKITREDRDNPAGLMRYVYSETGQHYKTVIVDLTKFKEFCQINGLEGDFSQVSEGHVLFTAYKGLYCALPQLLSTK